MFLARGSYPLGSWRGALNEMDRLRREMGRVMGSFPATPEGSWESSVFPLVNVKEDADNYLLSAELPGVTPEDLEISVKGKQVSLQGERNSGQPPEDVRYHRRERNQAGFSRLIGLPSEVDAGKVDARLENGVLHVKLPKAEAAKPRKIAVSAS
jgi:HSP20 family protein